MRGLVVGLGVFGRVGILCAVEWRRSPVDSGFALLGAALMGSLGVIAGLWAEKFDQLAAFRISSSCP